MTQGEALGREAARRLALVHGLDIARGLTDEEFAVAEARHGFEFADDHRAFLRCGLPTGPGWPDWRHPECPALAGRLGWPVRGVLFDVEHNEYWHPRWGHRPADAGAARELAEERLATAPRMVPIYSHRYLPPGRGTFGHPVLSIHQTDVIYYGGDLVGYVGKEFGHDGRPYEATVPFWKDLLDWDGTDWYDSKPE